MNKKITLISVFVILIFSINAQKVHSGIIGGLNLSKITSDESIDGEIMHMGGHILIPINIALFEVDPMKFSLQPEIDLSMQGSASEQDTVSSTFNSHYVKIPIMFKAHFGDNAFRPFINFGPYFGKHVMYYSSMKSGSTSATSDAETPDTQFMNAMDAGFNLGAGFNYDGFILEVRYGLGFSDVFVDINSKNRVLSFSIGYLMFE